MKTQRFHGCISWTLLILSVLFISTSAQANPSTETVRMLVMDPLCKQHACACVLGYAQRDYEIFGQFLEKETGLKFEVIFDDSLKLAQDKSNGKPIHLIIGKQSVILADGKAAGRSLRPIGMLTDQSGSTNLHGLFVVRSNDSAQSIKDIADRQITFGPAEAYEKNQAAINSLKRNGIAIPKKIVSADTCANAALDVVENNADVAVVSSYVTPLLEGCGTIDKGSMRVIGQTEPVPFITLFADQDFSKTNEKSLRKALSAMRKNKSLLTVMESKYGFVLFKKKTNNTCGDGLLSPLTSWSDFRGPTRDGHSTDVPERLANTPKTIWQKPLTGFGLGGIAANSRYVIVSDKLNEQIDVFRCFDADDGNELWAIQQPAAGEMDYGNSPRATPVIHHDKIYLLGAFGDLICAKLATGEVIWKTNMVKQFKAKVQEWGSCSTPLIIDDLLIVNPGAKTASIVAFNKNSGKVVWQLAGHSANYASMLLMNINGKQQVIAYDEKGIIGFDPKTGNHIWRLNPPDENYYVSPSPVQWKNKLVVSSEGNGIRVYEFMPNGHLNPKPLALNDKFLPTTTTPVIVGNRLFCNDTEMVCLDLTKNLQTIWKSDDPVFEDHISMFTTRNRLMICTTLGELILLDTTSNQFKPIDRIKLFNKTEDLEIWSHPALIDNRLYIRANQKIHCIDLAQTSHP